MIFTFPTSKTNEGFFFNRRFICSHSFRHNRDHKENSSIAQPSFPKKHWDTGGNFPCWDRHLKIWPISAVTTGWSSDRLLLAPFPTTGCNEQDVQIKIKKNVHRNVALSCTVIGQKLSHNQLNQSNAKLDLLRAFSTAVGSFRCCFCCRFFFF